MLQWTLRPVLVLMCMVMMMVCPALLFMLMKNDDTLLCAVAALLCVVARALDENEDAQPCAAAHVLVENEDTLPCAVAHAHDDDTLPLLLLMMSCFLLLLTSLCHTDPDFFKHQRTHVQTYERRHVDKRQTNHLLTSMCIDVSVFLGTDWYRGLFLGSRICTMRSITALVPKQSGKMWGQDTYQEKLTH